MTTNAPLRSTTASKGRLTATGCAFLLLLGALATPLAASDFRSNAEDALDKAPTLAAPLGNASVPGASLPALGQLVLNASSPSNPILAYNPGATPAVQVLVLNAEPWTGGYTITDPTGAPRFTNQASDEAGTVDFFEVSWATPYGEWRVTHKPGFPAITPQRQPGEAENPAYDPVNHADVLLLTFTIEPTGVLPAPIRADAEPWTGFVGNVTARPTSAIENPPDITLGLGGTQANLTQMHGSAGSSVYYQQNPGGPPGYVYCAHEGEHCSFPDTRDVAYGYNGHFYHKYGVTGGIGCMNSEFGDPYYGHGKDCYTKTATQTTYVPPHSGYIFCAYENEYCNVSGTKTVAYGNSGGYSYKVGRSTGILCSYQNFGDPLYGTPKACWTTDTYPPRTPPSGYSWCADQGGTCNFSGVRDVAYGAGGRFAYRYAVSGGFKCDVPFFGIDPNYGVWKSCYAYGGSSTQTACTNWQLRASHLKWVNTVVTHAPYGGTAEALLSAGTTRDEYWFGSGSTTQIVTGETLGTDNGKTAGIYVLRTASYYTCDINYRVQLSLPPQGDSLHQLKPDHRRRRRDRILGIFSKRGPMGGGHHALPPIPGSRRCPQHNRRQHLVPVDHERHRQGPGRGSLRDVHAAWRQREHERQPRLQDDADVDEQLQVLFRQRPPL